MYYGYCNCFKVKDEDYSSYEDYDDEEKEEKERREREEEELRRERPTYDDWY